MELFLENVLCINETMCVFWSYTHYQGILGLIIRKIIVYTGASLRGCLHD